MRFFRLRREFNPGKLEKRVKNDIAYQLGLKKHRLQNKIFSIAKHSVAFVVLSIFVSSIFSMPGDTFHGVKETTQDFRGFIQPGYKKELEITRTHPTQIQPLQQIPLEEDSKSQESEPSSSSGSSEKTSDKSGTSNSGSDSNDDDRNQDDDDDDSDYRWWRNR